MPKLTPARVASVLTAIGVIAAGVAPIIASLDVQSTASIMGTAVGLLVVLQQFLVGQRAHEARVAKLPAATLTLAPSTGSNVPGAFVTTTIPPVYSVAPAVAPVSDAVEFAKPPDSAITPDTPVVALAPLALTDVTTADLQTLADQRAAAPAPPI